MPEGTAQVLERGDVFFFYRPRVERNAPRGEDDVQRFLVVLAPEGRRILRVVAVGRKRMPDLGARGRERSWAWVQRVAREADEVEAELRGYRYATRTRGEREQPSARPAGEGAYAIARHGDHTHLAYALARPAEPGDVQRELGIRLDPAERGRAPDVFRALGIDPAEHPPAPLFTGDWA